MTKRLIVIGGGPIGLAAALGAIDRGFEVKVLERGRIGESLRTWGQTRFFTPFSMNVSPRMRTVLGKNAPAADAILSGPETADVLEQVANSAEMSGCIHENHRVLAVGRRGLTRLDYASHPIRAERPFRLLAEGPAGEMTLDAEIVLDASGGLSRPTPIGAGGLPARGERERHPSLIRTLGRLQELQLSLPASHVLLIGHGHSAANALLLLDEVARLHPSTRVTWAVRTSNRRPCVEVAGDPLPERLAVVAKANDLAQNPPAWLSLLRKTMVESIGLNNQRFQVEFTSGETGDFDHIAAFTGYAPDGDIATELALEMSPVTGGTLRLYNAISNVTDCLSVPAVRPQDLESGEPGYYMIGSRSYGRSRTFLLQTGLAHMETILDSVSS